MSKEVKDYADKLGDSFLVFDDFPSVPRRCEEEVKRGGGV